MKNTKANFKALREMVGVSQSLLADLLDVKVLTVKRWESPKYDKLPPDDAWELLTNFRERQNEQINYALDVFDMNCEQRGAPKKLQLTYWLGEADYKRAHPEEDERMWQVANATARLIANELREETEIEFNFQGLKATRGE